MLKVLLPPNGHVTAATARRPRDTRLHHQLLVGGIKRLLEGRGDGKETGVRARLDASILGLVAVKLARRQRPVTRRAVLLLP